MKKYKDLTSNEIKELCNGCGSKGGLLKPPNFIFKDSCNEHDYLYFIGGNKYDKQYADNKFYNQMINDIKELNLNYIKYLYYHSICYIYYQAVDIFGYKYFNYNYKDSNG